MSSGLAVTDAVVLAFDPWAGDRDSDAKTLRDVMLVTRATSTCAICRESIEKGARVRSQTQTSRDEGKVMTFKFCPTCCAAMASEADDDGKAIGRRYAIGMGLVSA